MYVFIYYLLINLFIYFATQIKLQKQDTSEQANENLTLFVSNGKCTNFVSNIICWLLSFRSVN